MNKRNSLEAKREKKLSIGDVLLEYKNYNTGHLSII